LTLGGFPVTPFPALRSPSWTVNSSFEAFMSAIRFGTPGSACTAE
jgi:hypothetical protein